MPNNTRARRQPSDNYAHARIVNERSEAELKVEDRALEAMAKARVQYAEDQAKEAQKTLDRITEGTADIFYDYSKTLATDGPHCGKA